MTTVDGVVDQVCLALNHTDAVVQLDGDTAVLVGSEVARLVESSIVGTNLGNVAVLAVAELRVVVAGCGVCRFGTAAGTSTSSRRSASRVQVRAQSDSSIDDALCYDASSTNQQSCNARRALRSRSGCGGVSAGR